MSDYDAARCLFDSDPDLGGHLSPGCHNLVWQLRYNMTHGSDTLRLAQRTCGKQLFNVQKKNRLVSCQQLFVNGQVGEFLLCMLDGGEDSEGVEESAECSSFIEYLALMVFVDVQTLQPFYAACRGDVAQLACGRLELNDDQSDSEAMHHQGATLACLGEHLSSLTKDCRRQVLRTTELQADDYHKDRSLFFACRNDREKFCAEVPAGDGRVYKCLREHSDEKTMSQQCRHEIQRREQSVVEDYKTSYTLRTACDKDLKASQCLSGADGLTDVIQLGHIILCLEDYGHRGYPVDGGCLTELDSHRRTLMSDYSLSPELVDRCRPEIDSVCSQHRNLADGKMIHCLIEHASNHYRNNSVTFTVGCFDELKKLIRMANLAEEWRNDKTMSTNCQSMVKAHCQHVEDNSAHSFNCLMSLLDSPQMNAECRRSLLLVQYFVVRDWKLDPLLYEACKKDAHEHCHYSGPWWSKKSPVGPSLDPGVLPCLYSHVYPEPHTAQSTVKLSRECSLNVRRVMASRADDMALYPEIDSACVEDLGRFCSKHAHKTGWELQCLMDSYLNLGSACQKPVKQLMKDAELYVELNPVVRSLCHDTIVNSCADSEEPGETMECLIQLKTEHSSVISERCVAAVKHFQLILQPDFTVSHGLSSHCHNDIQQLCPGLHSVSEVVECLSRTILQDKIAGESVRVSAICVKQIEFHIEQRVDMIALDPELNEKCSSDVEKFCHQQTTQGDSSKVFECLRDNTDDLQPQCKKLVQHRQLLITNLHNTDTVLLRSCKNMIRAHCSSSDGSIADIISCLKHVTEQPGFDSACRQVLHKRLIEQKHDIRMMPHVLADCHTDIQRHCLGASGGHLDERSPVLDGPIIQCLETAYRLAKTSEACSRRMRQLLREAAADSDQDPRLKTVCGKALKRLCHSPSAQPQGLSDGECLRRQLVSGGVQRLGVACSHYVAQLVQDVDLDVYTDPQLSGACAVELMRHCGHVSPGRGAQMACLQAVEKPSATCRLALNMRVQMLQMAGQISPLDSVGDLIDAVGSSPHRSVLLSFLAVLVILLLCLGIICGRATKRNKHYQKIR